MKTVIIFTNASTIFFFYFIHRKYNTHRLYKERRRFIKYVSFQTLEEIVRASGDVFLNKFVK